MTKVVYCSYYSADASAIRNRILANPSLRMFCFSFFFFFCFCHVISISVFIFLFYFVCIMTTVQTTLFC
uniref:Uncharacterized protein n=1 Tax=Anguilla anguilla TaxID=7936 RepID=A0A0E9X510_ANGAN